jgi:hypothetical protein
MGVGIEPLVPQNFKYIIASSSNFDVFKTSWRRGKMGGYPPSPPACGVFSFIHFQTHSLYPISVAEKLQTTEL